MPLWTHCARLPLLVCLAGYPPALPSTAIPEKITLRVWTGQASADVWVEVEGMGPGAASRLAELIASGVTTDLTGCHWEPHATGNAEAGGRCRDLLRPGRDVPTVRLRLAGIVREFHRRSTGRVIVDLLADTPLDTAPAGWLRDQQPGWRARRLWFLSDHDGQLPPEVPLRAVHPTPPSRVLIPLIAVLFVPGLAAYLVRIRASRSRADQKVNWLVWMNWILLASWLYWITAVDVESLLALLDSSPPAGPPSLLFTFLAATAVYAVPPLLAIASCLTAMAPLLSTSHAHFRTLLLRQLAGEASIILPLAIFLTGAGLAGDDLTPSIAGPLGFLGGAYLVYRALGWVSWRLTYVHTEPIESGPLLERARSLAARAGVPLARLSLRQTRLSEEANAFAVPGNAIVLTESLVRGLARRELDAVIAHELGHHKEGHLTPGAGYVLFFGALFLGGPAIEWIIRATGAPLWLASLPWLPLGLVLAQGLVSQRREYAADARAVEITGDAEGKIAALARLAQLSRVPARDGGIMGSILSHPSMEARVLRLARRFQVEPARALAILRDPNAAYGALPAYEAPPQDALSHEAALSAHTRAGYFERIFWTGLVAPPAVLALFALLAPAPDDSLQFFAGLMLAVTLGLWAAVYGEVLARRSMSTRLRKALAGRLQPPPDALFAGIHPGRGVRFTDGFADWDNGFLSHEGDWLRFQGERASFAIPRQVIGAIRAVHGRPGWLVEHRVEVRYRGGAFTFNTNSANPTRADAVSQAERLARWAHSASAPIPASPPPEPPPVLPSLPGSEESRTAALWDLCSSTFRLGLAGVLIGSVLPSSSLWSMALPFTAAATGFLSALPKALWPVRRSCSATPPPRLPGSHITRSRHDGDFQAHEPAAPSSSA